MRLAIALLFTLVACTNARRTADIVIPVDGAEEPVVKRDHTATRIALGSCNDQSEPQDHWRVIERAEPDLFIAAGDNVYADVIVDDDGVRFVEDPERLRAAYAVQGEHPEFKRFLKNVPVLATWDDHDYGLNNAGADLAMREASEAMFLDFWDVPADDPRRQRTGVYTSQMVSNTQGAQVQVIVLDTRSFRSELTYDEEVRGYAPDPDPEKTMLGEEQWTWLEAELRKPAAVRLLVSGVQVLPEDHRYERWGNLPSELERLVALIDSTRAGGVILISGDRHFGALYKRTESVPYPLWELSSSSLNKSFGGLDEVESLQVGGQVAPENFGLVDVNWNEGEVHLSLVTMDGEVAEEASIPMDSLWKR